MPKFVVRTLTAWAAAQNEFAATMGITCLLVNNASKFEPLLFNCVKQLRADVHVQSETAALLRLGRNVQRSSPER